MRFCLLAVQHNALNKKARWETHSGLESNPWGLVETKTGYCSAAAKTIGEKGLPL
jgi:hypothetical protein